LSAPRFVPILFVWSLIIVKKSEGMERNRDDNPLRIMMFAEATPVNVQNHNFNIHRVFPSLPHCFFFGSLFLAGAYVPHHFEDAPDVTGGTT
jgi:hypothetical protein